MDTPNSIGIIPIYFGVTPICERIIMQIDLDVVSYIGETSVTIRSSRRRITIPKEIVEKLGISDGDRIRWVLFNDGRLSISRVRTDEETSGGILIPVEGK